MQYQKHNFGNVKDRNWYIIAKTEIVIHVVKAMPRDFRTYVNLKQQQQQVIYSKLTKFDNVITYVTKLLSIGKS